MEKQFEKMTILSRPQESKEEKPKVALSDPEEQRRTQFVPEVKMHIMKRPTQAANDDKDNDKPKQPVKTLEQRRAEYNKARIRILGNAEPADTNPLEQSADSDTHNKNGTRQQGKPHQNNKPYQPPQKKQTNAAQNQFPQPEVVPVSSQQYFNGDDPSHAYHYPVLQQQQQFSTHYSVPPQMYQVPPPQGMYQSYQYPPQPPQQYMQPNMYAGYQYQFPPQDPQHYQMVQQQQYTGMQQQQMPPSPQMMQQSTPVSPSLHSGPGVYTGQSMYNNQYSGQQQHSVVQGSSYSNPVTSEPSKMVVLKKEGDKSGPVVSQAWSNGIGTSICVNTFPTSKKTAANAKTGQAKMNSKNSSKESSPGVDNVLPVGKKNKNQKNGNKTKNQNNNNNTTVSVANVENTTAVAVETTTTTTTPSNSLNMIVSNTEISTKTTPAATTTTTTTTTTEGSNENTTTNNEGSNEKITTTIEGSNEKTTTTSEVPPTKKKAKRNKKARKAAVATSDATDATEVTEPPQNNEEDFPSLETNTVATGKSKKNKKANKNKTARSVGVKNPIAHTLDNNKATNSRILRLPKGPDGTKGFTFVR